MIYIAVPLYENKVWVPFMHGLLQSAFQLTSNGFPVEYSFQTGTYIAMNREHLARNFLKTKCQFLLYIDSDIAFKPVDIMELIASNVDVVSGVYRFRTKVPNGKSNLPIKLVGGKDLDLSSPDTLQECELVPGGMLLIRRSVIEAMYEKTKYIFNQGFDNENTESIEDAFTGEDDHFCKLWRKLGGKIHVNTRVRVGHMGDFEYLP